MNNDGWLDLISTNGHVLDSRPRIPWKMPLQLMIGGPGGRLDRRLGSSSESRSSGCTSAGAWPSAISITMGVSTRSSSIRMSRSSILHNTNEHRPGHFIRFSLEGTASNRDGVGARVTIAAGGRPAQMSERIGGGSYQSASDPRLHFGLGASRQVESVEVRWPSGQVDRHGRLIADREYRLREGGKPIPADGQSIR